MLRVVASALAALAALAFDLRQPSVSTGVVALAALLVFALGGWVGEAPRRQPGSLLLETARVSRLRFLVLALLWVLIAVRGFMLYRLVIGPDAESAVLLGAARAYDELLIVSVLALSCLSLFTVQSARVLVYLSARPGMALVLSFALLICLSTLMLVLPIAVQTESHIRMLDALFMATSAVCVTGLATVDPGTTYTGFGQATLLVSVQLGGIGIMTIAALAATTGRGSVRSQSRYSRMLQTTTIAELRNLVRTVVVTALFCEALGVLLLSLLWSRDSRLESQPILWLATFHSVSAFCNAGLSLYPDNLSKFRGDAATLGVMSVLIVAGGVGFPVLRELLARLLRRWRAQPDPSLPPVRLSLNTRTSLSMTALLLAAGFAAVALLESDHSLSDLPWWERALTAAFTSVTARTAGFNSVDYGEFRVASLLVVMGLMFVGGAPGSCAGGIKTTTAAVIGAALRGELRGEEPRLFGRALTSETVRAAIAVAALSLPIALSCLLVLSLSEDQAFEDLAFESISAFGTVGLSTGITAQLSPLGKLAVIATMFCGRIGPLTIALAVARGRHAPKVRLAPEDLTVG